MASEQGAWSGVYVLTGRANEVLVSLAFKLKDLHPIELSSLEMEAATDSSFLRVCISLVDYRLHSVLYRSR